MSESMTPRAEVYRDGVVDVYLDVAKLQDAPRVVRDDLGVVVTRMEDVLHVTKRRDVHSTDPQVSVMVGLMGTGRPLIPLMLDGAEHTKYRRLLDPLFAPREIAKIEPRTRDCAATSSMRSSATARSISTARSAIHCRARSSSRCSVCRSTTSRS
jgi:cytochrome P450